MPAARIARSALIAAVAGLIGGLSGALIAQPAGRFTHPTAVTIANTAADALDVSGGLEMGSGDVALVGTDGKINGPLSTTILDNLSGVNLTSLNASNLGSGTAPTARLGTGTAGNTVYLRGDQTWSTLTAGHLTTGTMPMARQPANVIVDLVTDWEATEQSTQSTTTWSDTGLSATITVDDATNDLEIDVWQTIEFSTGNVSCRLRLVAGTATVLWTSASVANTVPYHLRHAYRHANPGSGNKTYKTQFIKTGGSATETCYVNSTAAGRSRAEAIMQIFEIAN